MTKNHLATTIILVRHGESEGNTSGRYQGQVDTGLSDRGRAQAQLVLQRLRGEPIDVLYTSDLRRAAETAEIIGQGLGLVPRPEQRLREIDIGAWSGLTPQEIAACYPDDWERFSRREDIRRGGAESMYDVRVRAEAALHDIVARHRGQTICAVCHGGVIFSLVAHWLGIPLRAAYQRLVDPRNTALTVVEFRASEVEVLSHGDASHLPTTFWLMRHGRTAWNSQGRWQGLADTPLDDVGREQARQAGLMLRHVKIDRIYSSDLARAAETARIVGDVVRLNPRLHPGLREGDIGDWAGLTTDEIAAQFPDEWRRFLNNDVNLRRGGGESLADLRARIVHTIQEIGDKEAGRNILVISHGAALRMLLMHALGLEYHERHKVEIGGNAAISKLVWQHGKFNVLEMNDTSHLVAMPEVERGRGTG